MCQEFPVVVPETIVIRRFVEKAKKTFRRQIAGQSAFVEENPEEVKADPERNWVFQIVKLWEYPEIEATVEVYWDSKRKDFRIEISVWDEELDFDRSLEQQVGEILSHHWITPSQHKKYTRLIVKWLEKTLNKIDACIRYTFETPEPYEVTLPVMVIFTPSESGLPDWSLAPNSDTYAIVEFGKHVESIFATDFPETVNEEGVPATVICPKCRHKDNMVTLVCRKDTPAKIDYIANEMPDFIEKLPPLSLHRAELYCRECENRIPLRCVGVFSDGRVLTPTGEDPCNEFLVELLA